MKRRRPLPLRTYPIVERAVEAGVLYGIRRAWKHRADPPAEDLVPILAEQIAQAVMLELSEVIQWEND
jgi:hypothetical protein